MPHLSDACSRPSVSVETLDSLLSAEELRRRFGDKGANLVLLRRIIPERVPEGFCIDADLCRMVIDSAGVNTELEMLERSQEQEPGDKNVDELSAAVRDRILLAPIPDRLSHDVASFLERFGLEGAYAVRSSAVGEDSPSASFAGMHDSFLNCRGVRSICSAIQHCWASLFSDRSIAYRFQHGMRQKDAAMAVIIQRQLSPEVSGVMFTADPLTGNRRGASISASFGLGTNVVSGTVDPDTYRLFDEKIISVRIGTKDRNDIPASMGEGVTQVAAVNASGIQALENAQIMELAVLGRKLETTLHPQTPPPAAGDYSGRVPLDIEWCLCDGVIHILQARPIPALFPAPQVMDGKLHVYVSVSHFQQMTDAMSPLGLSMFALPSNRVAKMTFIGGRMYVDVYNAPRN